MSLMEIYSSTICAFNLWIACSKNKVLKTFNRISKCRYLMQLIKYYLAHSFVAKLLVHSVGERGEIT